MDPNNVIGPVITYLDFLLKKYLNIVSKFNLKDVMKF